MCVEDEGSSYPLGQKILIVDGEEVPLLSIRTLEIDQPEDGETNPNPGDHSATIELNS